MIQQFMSRQFLAFLLTGATAASVNFGSRIVYSQQMDFSVSIILAYVTGMITAFILAKVFVFKDSQQALYHSVFYFVLVNLVAIVQTWTISMGLAYYALPALDIHGNVTEIAHATGVAIPIFTSYLGHKHLSFR